MDSNNRGGQIEMPDVTVEDFRKTCGSWDEEDGCYESYPDECPLREECERDALGTDGEKVPA